MGGLAEWVRDLLHLLGPEDLPQLGIHLLLALLVIFPLLLFHYVCSCVH